MMILGCIYQKNPHFEHSYLLTLSRKHIAVQGLPEPLQTPLAETSHLESAPLPLIPQKVQSRSEDVLVPWLSRGLRTGRPRSYSHLHH